MWCSVYHLKGIILRCMHNEVNNAQKDNRPTWTWLTWSDCHCRWIRASLSQKKTTMETIYRQCEARAVFVNLFKLPSDISAAHLNLNVHNHLSSMFQCFEAHSLLDMRFFLTNCTAFPISGMLIFFFFWTKNIRLVHIWCFPLQQLRVLRERAECGKQQSEAQSSLTALS